MTTDNILSCAEDSNCDGLAAREEGDTDTIILVTLVSLGVAVGVIVLLYIRVARYRRRLNNKNLQ